MTRPQELQLHVRRLVVDASVLDQSGLSAETLPFALQQALQHRMAGDAPQASPQPAQTIDRLADAVWSQLGDTGAQEP